jgi:hypothetical protein
VSRWRQRERVGLSLVQLVGDLLEQPTRHITRARPLAEATLALDHTRTPQPRRLHSQRHELAPARCLLHPDVGFGAFALARALLTAFTQSKGRGGYCSLDQRTRRLRKGMPHFPHQVHAQLWRDWLAGWLVLRERLLHRCAHGSVATSSQSLKRMPRCS